MKRNLPGHQLLRARVARLKRDDPRLTDEDIAKQIGMSKAHFSTVLNRQAVLGLEHAARCQIWSEGEIRFVHWLPTPLRHGIEPPANKSALA